MWSLVARQPGETEKSLVRASRWGFGLGFGLVALGCLWLDQYLSTGGVYLDRERIRLSGPDAFTALLGALGGGLGFLGFAIHYRLRLRTLRRQSQ